jgi:hypothetical protein
MAATPTIEHEGQLRLRIRVSPPPREHRVLWIWTQNGEEKDKEPRLIQKTRKDRPQILLPLAQHEAVILADMPTNTHASVLTGSVFRIERYNDRWTVNGAPINTGLEYDPGPISGRNILFDIASLPAVA